MLSCCYYFLIYFLLIFCPLSLCSEELPQGLQYWKIITSEQQIVHTLEIDPLKVTIIAAHANNTARGRETVAAIARQHKALAAINGGFFRIGNTTDGLPAGVLKIQDRWYNIAYRYRGAMGWINQNNEALFDQIQTKTTLTLNGHTFPVHLMNQPSSISKTVIFTDAFGEKADSHSEGQDIVILNNKIIAIKPGGDTIIPKGGYVYAIGPKAKMPEASFHLNDSAEVKIEVLPRTKEKHGTWQQVENIIGGAPLLIHNGKKIRDYSFERIFKPFIYERHARTGVGLLRNGHWIFMVVENNPGMTLPELARIMHKSDCVSALNLDGGHSSSFYLDDGVIYPGELPLPLSRHISDAILILKK